ncbi:hypothetical protein [Pleomorphomonas sp. NRK KF1]|uniref:hypothetical protein n=1 Tax=Pleomorphomonas sp. NRK KF1 TaxID=2943000 RepID=UPI002044686D|nr:hypothetical protein [Pleomorphomonas sp. NRK KF1]MCM5555236.1 hypothetical protein [Pleomorphomonas sp. NRK KF1]
MSNKMRGTIESDNAELKALASRVGLASLFPVESEPHQLATAIRDLPSLPDRFNAVLCEHGWVYVMFACGHEAAEHALTMHRGGADQSDVDAYLAESLLRIEAIKWQALKVLGGGMVEPEFPVRAKIVERVFEAYESGDYIVFVPLVLMLVDGFGVSATGTKSMFSEQGELDELFQSSESVAGHPSALKKLLGYLRSSQRGYSEQPLTTPFRNGILHGTRLNYANRVTAAKAMNLLAAVVEWARDIAPEPKNEASKKEWNARFLTANLSRLNPESPQAALELFQSALTKRRASDLVALTSYHPVITLLSEKIKEWWELASVTIVIEPLSPWELIGNSWDTEQYARCMTRLFVTSLDGGTKESEHMLLAVRSSELAHAKLPSVWRIDLGLLGAIRCLLADSS